MKTLLLPAESDIDVLVVVEKALPSLSERVGILTTAQHLSQMDKVKEFLEKKGKTAIIGGQILGCNQKNAEKILKDVDCFLYVGSGEFHPIGVIAKLEKKLLVADPLLNKVSEVDSATVKKMCIMEEAAHKSFILANKVGVLVSLKSGQNNYKKARKLETQYPEKSWYFFTCHTLDFGELENFPFIEVWVNTMCPRIGFDDYERTNKPMVNLKKIWKEESELVQIK